MSKTQVQLVEGCDVKLVQHIGNDLMTAGAAWVSVSGLQAAERLSQKEGNDPTKLIDFLMSKRHGCYDEQTEVLTDDGWKKWPTVTGKEKFVTLSSTDEIEYQEAERLVVRDADGPMIRVEMKHVDALVTPDHNMFAMRRSRDWLDGYSLVPAKNFLDASHRVRMGGGVWSGERKNLLQSVAFALLGFFIGDGSIRGKTGIVFHLKRKRKIRYLRKLVGELNEDFQLFEQANDKYLVEVPDSFICLAQSCYDELSEKVIPKEVLVEGKPCLQALLCGLTESDGSVARNGSVTFSTTSLTLTGQLQELLLKLGQAAVICEHPFSNGDGHYGSKPRYRVSFYRKRNLQPKVGWTTVSRLEQVKVVNDYKGKVYCVTVPNGTLYVRRNGKPMWCGNTPFEHNSMTFFIDAPIFVWREFHRHRIGFSYNEVSGRYSKLEPRFWICPYDRPLMPVEGYKATAPQFKAGPPELVADLRRIQAEQYQQAYDAYEELLAKDVAKEVARTVLPVGIMSQCWVTCNARSMMSYLSLRTHDDSATFVSYPQEEIQTVARKMEEVFSKLFPVTYASFQKHGRVAP